MIIIVQHNVELTGMDIYLLVFLIDIYENACCYVANISMWFYANRVKNNNHKNKSANILVHLFTLVLTGVGL